MQKNDTFCVKTSCWTVNIDYFVFLLRVDYFVLATKKEVRSLTSHFLLLAAKRSNLLPLSSALVFAFGE